MEIALVMIRGGFEKNSPDSDSKFMICQRWQVIKLKKVENNSNISTKNNNYSIEYRSLL